MAPTDVDKIRLEIAKSITHKILTGQKEGKIYKLTNSEATSTMVLGLNELKQKLSYDSISGKYGNYKDLSFRELLIPRDGTLYEVYRFEGKFSSTAHIEIRTTLDGNGKLAGIYALD